MGEKLREGNVLRLRDSVPQDHSCRMHILLVFVYISLVVPPECSGLPMKEDSVKNTINSILSIAQITLVHITKLRAKLPASPRIEFSTPAIEGLASISHDLGLLDKELQIPVTELLSQIRADVSSLEGRVRSFALTMDCSIPARPTGDAGSNLFPDSRLYQTLTKVQRYLEKVLLHKDKLKVC